FWSQGYLFLVEGIAVIIGSVIGSRIGSFVSLQTKLKWLEAGLSILIIVLAVATFLNAVFA
ncbi:MAG: hypothetical protein P1Q69_14585, partial [Candidatus Thorarchaeota archaeon]|nr:hypothetical protein [Candidatus Thorarchaeota archaeon]